MDKPVGEQLQMGILNVSDLRNYYWVFYTITKFLLTKNQSLKQNRVKPLSENSNQTSSIGFLIDSRSSYLTMIPMTFILYLKLTRLQNMFYITSHKTAFYSQALHRPHPQLTGITVHQSGRSINAIREDGTKFPQSTYPAKVDN
jgi:hypothetical protein